MSLYFSFFILILGCRRIYSASILETEKPALEGLSPTKYPVTSPLISQTSAATLKGYVAMVIYGDYYICKTPLAAIFHALNTCYRSGEYESTYVTATSSFVHTVTYTDSMCTRGAVTESKSYTDGVCAGSAFTADIALAVMR